MVISLSTHSSYFWSSYTEKEREGNSFWKALTTTGWAPTQPSGQIFVPWAACGL